MTSGGNLYRHAIITGGSSGIGKALAVQLTQAGANVTLMARTLSELEKTQAMLNRIRSTSTQVIHIEATDVSDPLSIHSAITNACQKLGSVDLLITCAGIACADYFKNISATLFEQIMKINYLGSVYAVQAALPIMRQQHKGHIVFISSGAGLVGLFGYCAYSPTKFAIRGFAEALRSELAIESINVSVVYPPDTNTLQLDKENLTKPEETKCLTGNAAMWQPEDVAKVIMKGIRKKRFAITPGFAISLLNSLNSLLGPILRRYFDKQVKGIHKKSKQ